MNVSLQNKIMKKKKKKKSNKQIKTTDKQKIASLIENSIKEGDKIIIQGKEFKTDEKISSYRYDCYSYVLALKLEPEQ